MIKIRQRLVYLLGLVSLALSLTSSRARGDVYNLQDLLNGETITSNGLTYENFRSYSSLAGEYPGPALSIDVTTTFLGLSFTGLNGGTLAGFPGQGPFGASFTFDVSATAGNAIGIASVSVSGLLESAGTMQTIPPYYTASLQVTGASPSPLNLSAEQQNNGSSGNTISGTVSAAATFPNVTFLTVNESFAVSGLTDHAFNSLDDISSVSVAFVPEPSPFALVGALGAIMMLAAHRGRKNATRLDSPSALS